MPRPPLRRCRAVRTISIEDRIAQLRDLDLSGLRTCWHNELGRPAPKHLTRYLLFRILAYKIQVHRFGDLDADTFKILDRTGGDENQPTLIVQSLAALDQRRFTPTPGTVLVREWDRKSYRVMVMPDGFAWNGKTFDNLSQIALAITGTKWNGPRFFGLRDRPPQIKARESK